MRRIDLPAGSRVRLAATARPDCGLHRWDIRVLSAGGEARMAYGSQIGGQDLDQRLEIPVQDVDCSLEVRSVHATLAGWVDDHIFVEDDTPNQLQIGFCDLGRPGARHDDVLMNFTFSGSAREA